jgi:hypothetical protein
MDWSMHLTPAMTSGIRREAGVPVLTIRYNQRVNLESRILGGRFGVVDLSHRFVEVTLARKPRG